MKVLVTGYAGFIGQHLVRALTDRGHTVYGIDIESGQGLKSGRSQKADVREFFAKDDQDDWGAVYHCAAIVGGRKTIDNEPMRVSVDLSIDAEMFQWAMRVRPKKVVYYSSSAAYPIDRQGKSAGEWHGHSRPFQLSERLVKYRSIRGGQTLLANPGDYSISNPDAVYGWIKLTSEMQAEHCRNEGLDVLVLRPFSGYCGITQSLDYPFPSLVQRAMNHTNPFPIWGDPSSMRDWVHVSDVVGATLAAVENDVQGPVNICTGIGTRFDDLVRMMGAEVGYEPEIVGQSDKPMGVHTRVGDPALMKTFYKPKVTVEEGVHRAVEHFRKETT